MATALTISDKPSPKNPRIIDQTITICGRRGDRRYSDQGLEGSELSLYTNGMCSGVRIVSRLLPASLDRYLAALPAMSLTPVAPFAAIPLGFRRCRILFVQEWNMIGREDSSDVADHHAGNAFNRLLGLVVYPRNNRRARLR